ncbi:MAG: cobyrinic acid a,c-diamide synthase [Burkholderiaceae bacterium]|jgi:cobyrinic acid a,c-diamide synthase
MVRHCPALLISAPASNQGKTTVTAALARHHRSLGRKVVVFKTGPDFLDPMILQRASGNVVHQLDLWLAGEAACRQLLYDAAGEADLILIEGVMGLFDGTPCSADVAERFSIPVLAVIDATGLAQTIGAIAAGLAGYRPAVTLAGVLANAVASDRHEEMLLQGMPASIRYLGGVRRNALFALPRQHLGLLPAAAVSDLDARLDALAACIAPLAVAALPADVAFTHAECALPAPLLQGLRIGVARDAAFSFLYPANLALLEAMGATLHFFSPLVDTALPEVDSIYLPGGFPELHLAALQNNQAMHAALRAHVAADKPLFAECGGLLYLLESLTDKAGPQAAMAALLPGSAHMQGKLQGLGYQSAPMPGGVLRAHTFHYSQISMRLAPAALGERLFNTSAGEAIYQVGRLTATYLHCYFPSNPVAAARLFLL